MVEVKNITKIYGRGKKKVVALDDVSFVLPDSGMIFIVGKSGCGKSTLLNMIGGCDKLTAGDIVMDGNKFSAFRERDYDHFRNDHVGFIFQDYCLLEGLTVEQNVSLALELKGERDDAAVRDALSKVGLSDCLTRHPDELSGGQKQRVAIARTLVKNPKLILADEPTGNLDEKSTRIILDILKEMSRSALVVIVSHNRPDAERYADRILTLSAGKIVGDITRNPNAEDIAFDGHDIIVQKGTVFTEAQIDSINEKISSGARLRQTDTKFLPTVPPEPTGKTREFSAHGLSFRGRKAIFKLFSKKRALGMVFSALLAVFLFIVLGVCQFFTQFDAGKETARIMQSQNGMVLAMRKGHVNEDDPTKTLDTSRLLRVSEAEVAAFRDAGYKGNIYPLYNVAVITDAQSAGWQLQGYRPTPDSTNYGAFFCCTGLGVLQVTEEYLAALYGKDGKLNVLSGEIAAEGDGVIVTDYFADSLLIYDTALRITLAETAAGEDPYKNITGGQMLYDRYRVAAVIETGYAERYAPLLEARDSGKNLVETVGDLAIRFYEELNDSLNLAYTVNPDFMAAYNEDGGRSHAYFGGGNIEADGKTLALSTMYAHCDNNLKEGEILLNQTVYCELVGKNATDIDWESVKGKKIKLSLGDLYSDTPFFEQELTIARVYTTPGSGNAFYMAPGTFKELLSHSTYAYALYFDNVESAIDVYDAGTEMGYTVQSPLFSAMYTVSGAANVFVDLFEIIIWVMYALVGLTLVGFAAGSVKKCIYEIGVLRAMGGKNGDLVLLFVLQMILMSVAVCLLAGLGLWLGADISNAALAEGFAAVTKNAAMREIHFVAYSWTTVLFDAGIVFGLTVLCAVVPLLLLRRIKPREIIRAKE